MTAFYNENEPYAAAWLRNLIAAGHIAPGVVDERSIVDIDPDELAGYTQCHFFAGIGVWSHALRLAGWSDDQPVWTGSCPCQPFSAAGKGKGHEDERHLWPAWQRLISKRKPAVVFGEQVSGSDGLAWLDVVLSDLEDDHYAVAAADLPAAGVGAPHIRQRLFFMAHAERTGIRPSRHRSIGSAPSAGEGIDRQRQRVRPDAFAGGDLAGLLGNAGNAGNEGLAQRVGFPGIPGEPSGADEGQASERTGVHAGAVAESGCERWDRREGAALGRLADGSDAGRLEGHDGPVSADEAGFWSACDWLPCRDGKARPVEPGTFPLAHGAPARVGRLRAYGNAIVAPAAAAFIEAAAAALTEA